MIAELVKDLLVHSLIEGTLVTVNNRLFKNLEYADSTIKVQIKISPVVLFDETGLRCSVCTHAECNTHNIGNLKDASENLKEWSKSNERPC